MEKINIYKQAPELIDGLLAIVSSVRKMLLNMKYSDCTDKPTVSQLSFMRTFNISYTAVTSKEQADKLIKLKGWQLLDSLKKINTNDTERGENDGH